MKWVIKQFYFSRARRTFRCGPLLLFEPKDLFRKGPDFFPNFSLSSRTSEVFPPKGLHMPRKAGLEPVISSVTGWRFNQLSYFPLDYRACTFSDFLSNLMLFLVPLRAFFFFALAFALHLLMTLHLFITLKLSIVGLCMPSTKTDSWRADLSYNSGQLCCNYLQ